MKESELYKRTIEFMGERAQRSKAIEECAELIVAIEKENIGRATPQDVITEIADVMIMAEQLAMIYGPEKVRKEKTYKQQRLLSRISGMDMSDITIEQE